MEPPRLPEELVLIDNNDRRADLEAWLDLYNRAFDGEWRHWPEDIKRWVQTIQQGFGLAVIGDKNQPAGLSVSTPELFYTAHERRNPIGHILIVCSAPEFRGRKVAKALVAESLRRFAASRAGTVSIETDIQSIHRSHEIYEHWGFTRAVEWCIWERRLA